LKKYIFKRQQKTESDGADVKIDWYEADEKKQKVDSRDRVDGYQNEQLLTYCNNTSLHQPL